MIVRGGNRTVTDLGPAPARIAGIYAVNTIATAPETHVAPVERRYLTREELARIHEDDALLGPQPAQITLPTKVRTRAPQPVPVPKHKVLRRLKDDEPLWAALRQTRGNVSYAAELIGRDRGTVRANLLVRLRRGTIPPDVAWLLEHPKRRPSIVTGTHLHTPESRALISLRLREHHAKKRRAAA